jgi:inorganic pyrophosphatase
MSSLCSLTAIAERGVIRVVIESPAGATTKIKHDPEIDEFVMSRPLPLGLAYPHDWGFVPGTRAPDDDPLDALVLSEGTTYPGLVIAARPIGVLRLEQKAKRGGRERNDRVLAVAKTSRRAEIQTFADLPVRMREELEQFFVNAVFFENKDPALLGWGGPDEAWALVQASLTGNNQGS